MRSLFATWTRVPVAADNHVAPWLIAGLGNPEARYENTRHNVGFAVVDLLAARFSIDVTSSKYRARLGQGCIRETPVILLKPQTYMNESGRSIKSAVQFRKVPPAQIVVVSDDLDLPLGRVRVRPNGSSGGHGGLKSIIKELGSQEFGRVRIGIGRPAQGDVIEFVLQPFHPTERKIVEDACERAATAVEQILEHGYEYAMQAVSR